MNVDIKYKKETVCRATLTYQSNKDMCISSKLHPKYSAFSLNQFMDAPHCQNGQQMLTKVVPRDITLNKSKVL